MTFGALLLVTALIYARPSQCFASSPSPLPVETLLTRAQSFVDEGDPEAAFSALSQVYAQDPDAPGLSRLFEACLRLKIQTNGGIQDCFGLAALLLDQERYEEASIELRHILHSADDGGDDTDKDDISPQVLEKASSMLFRSNAACCHWGSYIQDSISLVDSLRLHQRNSKDSNPMDVPSVHPFEALKWPCISLSQATNIAALYARRSIASTSTQNDDIEDTDSLLNKWKDDGVPPQIRVSRESDAKYVTNRKIQIGYLSPDFTSSHPLAFLMQRVFGNHDRDKFHVKLYSLSKWDEEGDEVRNIQQGSDEYVVLPAESPEVLAKQIQDDHLDILVDLCGYAGTDRVSQILSLRPAPIQVSYMGFPASSGAPYLDYLVCDQTVVPPELRTHYTERLIFMPHCYFVNSHAASVSHLLVQSEEERHVLRKRYNLPENAFVYCCHSRPDKIDPSTFRTWLRALTIARDKCADCQEVVLWLLRSGSEMEENLVTIAIDEFQLEKEALVFCNVAPRDEHLQRLACADVFLDTPAYNAHTLGCDTLFAGVPMISLLRPCQSETDHDEKSIVVDPLFVNTEKLASRVGASLLQAAGLEEMVCPRMRDYAALMVTCAVDKEWFASIRTRLNESRMTCPLFDTKRWVENLELAFRQIVLDKEASQEADIVVSDMLSVDDNDMR